MRRKALAASAMVFLVVFLVHAHVPALPTWLGRSLAILMVVSGLVHAGTSMFGSATDLQRPAAVRRRIALGIAAVCTAFGVVGAAGVLSGSGGDAPVRGPARGHVPGADCTSCHAPARHPTGPLAGQAPQAGSCASCHDITALPR